jgi:DNA-binding transcriptional LysR family regulator
MRARRRSCDGRRITLLEKPLGVTLLNRTPDGFATRSAGDAILRQCMVMEYAALDLGRVAAGRDSLVTGSVRVTTTEALAYSWLPPPRFHGRVVGRRTRPVPLRQSTSSKPRPAGWASPNLRVSRAIFSPDLVRVWPIERPANRGAWLIVHHDMRRSARIRAITAAIGDAFRRQRRTLEQGNHSNGR